MSLGLGLRTRLRGRHPYPRGSMVWREDVPRGVFLSLSVRVSLVGGRGAGPARILLHRNSWEVCLSGGFQYKGERVGRLAMQDQVHPVVSLQLCS